MAEQKFDNPLRCRCDYKPSKKTNKKQEQLKQKVESWLNDNPYNECQSTLKDIKEELIKHVICENNYCHNKHRLKREDYNYKNNIYLQSLNKIKSKLKSLEHQLNETNRRLSKTENLISRECSCNFDYRKKQSTCSDHKLRTPGTGSDTSILNKLKKLVYRWSRDSTNRTLENFICDKSHTDTNTYDRELKHYKSYLQDKFAHKSSQTLLNFPGNSFSSQFNCPAFFPHEKTEICPCPKPMSPKKPTTVREVIDNQKQEILIQTSEMLPKHHTGFQCINKSCERTTGDCSCTGDNITDHTLICTMSCEITKLRKDILDLKVMIANCLMILENETAIKQTIIVETDKNVKGEADDKSNVSSGQTSEKRKKKCCKKKSSTKSENPPPPSDEKKPKCYLSRMCKYCCLKF